MRSFGEIKKDLDQAFSTNDAEALICCATELDCLGTPLAEATASSSRGWALVLRGDCAAALEHFRKALALYEELDDRRGVAAVSVKIGNVFVITGDYAAAFESFYRALALLEQSGGRREVAGTTANIGLVYFDTGDYPAALEHYHRALALCNEIGDRPFEANIICNIGSVYQAIGDYPAALEQYQQALVLYSELSDRSGVARVTGNIGLLHASTGRYSDALEHYHRALALHEELGERSIVASVKSNMIVAYQSLGSDAEAQSLLEILDTMQIDDPGVRISRELHRAAQQERNGDLESATITLQLALSEAEEHSLRSKTAGVHKALRDMAQKRNDFAAYIEHNNEFARITEVINGKATAQRLAMMDAEKRIAAERAETEKHRALLYNILPPSIAERVLRGENVNDAFENAAVMFMDMVGFTTMSATMDPNDVVRLLSEVFTACDAIMTEYDLMKIKTIGDSYMAVSFPLESSSSEHRTASPEERAASAASAMLQLMLDRFPQIRVRIGLHCGPVTAGVIGTERLQYDVWGDTVNTASRMESTSEPGRIHVSSSFALALNLRQQDQRLLEQRQGDTDVIPSVNEEPGTRHLAPGTWHLALRGETELKGKGMMTTYWLERA